MLEMITLRSRMSGGALKVCDAVSLSCRRSPVRRCLGSSDRISIDESMIGTSARTSLLAETLRVSVSSGRS
ncbi:MAG: hypothetical protein KAW17_01025 [Candidatus Eisenbacteria sp.]|nr:hypothetical protein [Candidatus Eisenbacteria bacterium]